MTKTVAPALAVLVAVAALAAPPTPWGVPIEARKLLIQAELHQRLGESEKALKKVTAALKLADGCVEAHHLYQDIRLALDERKGLLARYRARAEQKPDDGTSLYLLGRVVTDIGEKESLLLKAINADPKLGWAYYALGHLYEHTRKWDMSEKHFTTAIALDADNAEFHHGYGFCLMQQGKDAEAEKAHRMALERDPDHVDSIVNRSVLAMRAKDYAGAEKLCLRVLEIDKDNPWAQNNLGKALFWQGKNASALRAYQAAASNPRYDTPEVAYLNMGFVCRKQEKPEQAAAAFRRALEINPAFAYAHVQLAYTLHAQKKYDDAWADVLKAEALGYKPHAEFLKALATAKPRPTEKTPPRHQDTKND